MGQWVEFFANDVSGNITLERYFQDWKTISDQQLNVMTHGECSSPDSCTRRSQNGICKHLDPHSLSSRLHHSIHKDTLLFLLQTVIIIEMSECKPAKATLI